nr:hypothetical protein [uncultured Flavobacterium sp.]
MKISKLLGFNSGSGYKTASFEAVFLFLELLVLIPYKAQSTF